MKRHFGLAVQPSMADSTAPRFWQEITGARCRITSGNFNRAQLVKPAPAGGAGHGAGRTCAGGGLHLGSAAGTNGSATNLWLIQSRHPVADKPGSVWSRMVVGYAADPADALPRPSGRHVLSPLRAAAVALLLAGCAEMAPPGTTTVRVEPRSDAEPPLARGETQLVVRAVSAHAPGREFPGAICDANSPYFASRFTAPARLLIPDYGSQTPEIMVSCEANGASGRATVAPQASYSGGGFGAPAVGISVGTGGGWNGWGGDGVGVGLSWWGGGGGYGEPLVRYPALRVPMR
jgi:hypothetical protein